MKRYSIAARAIAVFALVNSAQGVTTTYTDRAAFEAAAAALYGPVTTEGYETYANDLQSGARTITLNYFNVSYDLSGDDSQFGVTDVLSPGGGSGVGPTAGSKYLDANFPTSSGPTTTVSFLFDAAIHAFGTDIKDLENANLNYSTNSGANGIAAMPGADGNVQFFGIISTDQPFTSIGFSEPPASTGDGVAFDQASFDVPEPATWAAGLLVLAGLVLSRRAQLTSISHLKTG